MAKRPSRAKMCNWLSAELHALVGIMPFNPANIELLATRARDADRRLSALAHIAAELGWHADASLDVAFELIQKYDEETP